MIQRVINPKFITALVVDLVIIAIVVTLLTWPGIIDMSLLVPVLALYAGIHIAFEMAGVG